MGNWDTSALAAKLFTGEPPPDRDRYVLDQGFVRNLSKCRELLPESQREAMWPAELDSCIGDGVRRRIDRRVLLTIGKRARSSLEISSAAAQLHSAVVFWGAPPGMPMARACRPLREEGAAPNLAEALKTVLGAGAVSAYKSMSKGGRHAIRGLGPSYFTKLFYFGGYDAKPHMPNPLIMDDNVIKALGWLTDQPWGHSAEMYRDYLDLAADIAFEVGCEPDVVERKLFDVGE